MLKIYSQRPGFVSVRISVPSSNDVCRGRFLQVGLELPVANPALKSALSEIKRGKGILMADLARKATKPLKTHFQFDGHARLNTR